MLFLSHSEAFPSSSSLPSGQPCEQMGTFLVNAGAGKMMGDTEARVPWDARRMSGTNGVLEEESGKEWCRE